MTYQLSRTELFSESVFPLRVVQPNHSNQNSQSEEKIYHDQPMRTHDKTRKLLEAREIASDQAVIG